MTPEEINEKWPHEPAQNPQEPQAAAPEAAVQPEIPVQSEQPTVVAEPPADQPRAGKSSKKLFVIIGAVVVLLLIAVAGIFAFMQMQRTSEEVMTEASPSPTSDPSAAEAGAMVEEDPMSDWESYTNDEFGVSFKYPPELSVLSQSTSVVSPTDNTPTEHSTEFAGLGDSQVLLVLYIQPGVEAVTSQGETEEMVLGKNLFLKHDGFYKNAPVTYYSVVRSGGVYSLVVLNVEETQVENILSTFEFVDESDMQERTDTY